MSYWFIIELMTIHTITLLGSLILFTTHTYAGCPAMVIQQANTDIMNCLYSEAKPEGVVMGVIINYSNERHMGEQSAKNMKTKIFQSSDNKNACKKFMKEKTFCMNLSQWCRMAGEPPYGARFTVNSVINGKCPAQPKI